MPLDQSATPTRAALLHDARDHLERAERHDQWDCAARDSAWRAAELLRRAGLPELADICGDEFGCDIAAVLACLEREMRG